MAIAVAALAAEPQQRQEQESATPMPQEAAEGAGRAAEESEGGAAGEEGGAAKGSAAAPQGRDPPPEEVVIGSLVPLTGDIAGQGAQIHAATLLAVDDFNARLEEDGAQWRMRMVTEDTETSPVAALEKLSSLHARGITLVVGPETSASLRNIKGYADSADMLLLSCCSAAPALAIPGDSVYRLIPDERAQARIISALAGELGAEVIVPVYRGDAWGDGLVGGIRAHFASAGGAVEEGIRYNPEQSEFSASVSLLAESVSRLSAERGPGGVAVVLASFAEALPIMQTAAEYDSLRAVRWLGTDGNALDEGVASDRIAGAFARDVGFAAALVAISDSPAAERVAAELGPELGGPPIVYAHMGYDTVWLVGLSVIEAGTADAGAVKAALPGVADAYVGAMGDIRLNEAGDLADADYEVWRVVVGGGGGEEGAGWAPAGSYDRRTGGIEIDPGLR